MLPALIALFLCQLAGETLVRGLGIAFPGPVLGMALFFLLLLAAGRTGEGIGAVADALLRNLSLLFVPAAVGLVQQANLIADHWLAIGVGLAVSTLLTLLVVPTFYDSIEVARDRAIAKFHARSERWNAFAGFALTLLEALATLLGLRLVWRLLRRGVSLVTGGRGAATPA